MLLRVLNAMAAGSTPRGFAVYSARVSPSGSCASGSVTLLAMSVNLPRSSAS
jgi:hypothetical protein